VSQLLNAYSLTGRRFTYFRAVFTQILFLLFCLSVVLQCAYALYFFVRVFFVSAKNKSIGTNDKKPVSIIICAKNEAHNLQQYLPAILAQRYTNEAGKLLYEVIVVNDASSDDSDHILNELQNNYGHLQVVTISRYDTHDVTGKKYALKRGVAAAQYDWLLFTDADCTPASTSWLADMAAAVANNKKIAAGYGKYVQHSGLLNAFIRWETMHTFLQYSSYAMAGKPYMAVGRNLLCEKEMWHKAETSEIWNILPSGDDDLLMQTQATGQNTAIVESPRSFTVSEPKGTMKEWLKQKQRHMSTGKYYRPDIKALLSVYASSHAAMWLLFFILLAFINIKLLVYVLLVRCLLYWIIWAYMAKKLQEKKIILLFPLLDIGWMIYNFALSPYIIWKNKRQWK
jgi:glycosyltransferase involved in cell wall biosynthesis